MKCVFCGGPLEEKHVTFSYEDEETNKYLLVEDVPAEVCTHCGEKTYSPVVTDKLLRYAKEEFSPIKTVVIPVFHFS